MRPGPLTFEPDENIRSPRRDLLNDRLQAKSLEIVDEVGGDPSLVSRWVLTGDADKIAGKLEQALPVDDRGISRCLECHSSLPIPADRQIRRGCGAEMKGGVRVTVERAKSE
jgi:hypothetical protein